MKRLTLITLAAVLCLAAVQSSPARGDIGEAIAAYDGGDLESAHAGFLAAAQAGDPAAQVALASLYQFGEGIARDPARAARWYRHAAEQGDAVAAANLGSLYATGDGVPRDRVEAVAWLTVAASRGNKWAEAERALLDAALSHQERAGAARLADRRTSDDGDAAALSGEATVLDGQTLVVAEQTLRLEGIAAPPLGHQCRLRGTMRDCGLISGTALKDLTAGVHVECTPRSKIAADGVRFARCQVDGYDLSEGMVYTGWARADKAQTDRYERFETGARARKRGMWRTE